MTKKFFPYCPDRRRCLKLAGSGLVMAASGFMAPSLIRTLTPISFAEAAEGDPVPNLYFGGTDGWISLPRTPTIPPFHPDDLAPNGLTTYIFGFRNITGMSDTQKSNQKNKAQHNAPLFWVDQYDPNTPRDFRLQLTNLGLAVRPDLFDAHTMHWHGFRNVIPFFDGEPTGSVAVTAGRDFTYVFRPRDPGTYMYHCHVEDTEHVHMGMTGLVFVRPRQNGTPYPRPAGSLLTTDLVKFAYNDGDGSTGYDREFAMFLSEVWAEAHWADAHIQLPEWSDYRADFALLNGRVYPDTLAPNGSIDPFHPVWDANGDLIAPDGRPDLQFQPLSSLVKCNAGERVLLRFANLGFKEAAMTLAGITMRVVGRDATPMRGIGGDGLRSGADTSYETNTLSFGAGESFDAIFTAPVHSGGAGPDIYMLYNRAYAAANNLSTGGFGGQATEIHVYPAGTLPPQSIPNT